MGENAENGNFDKELLDFCRGDKEAAKRVQGIRDQYDNKWWKSSDPFERAWGQLNEERLITDINDFKEALSNVLGRDIYTHDLINPNLKEEMRKAAGNRDLDSITRKKS